MGEVAFYIGQALGAVAVILGFINYQVKTREKLLIIHLCTTVCFAFHYMCLGAWAGMAMNLIGFVRNFVFYHTGKKGKTSRWLAAMFAVIMGAGGAITSILAKEPLYFLLSVIGLMVNSFSMSFQNPNNIRKSILISSPLVLLYDIFVWSVGGAVYEAIVIISSIIGIIRFGKKDKK